MPEHLSPGVYVSEIHIGAKRIEGVDTRTAGFVGMAEKGEQDKPILVTSWAHFAATFGRHTEEQPHLAPAVFGFFANGGNRCYVVRVADRARDGDYVGTDSGPGHRTGLQTLDDVGDVSLVCVPGITSRTVQSAMITHCERLKNRFCILDTAEDADAHAVETQRDEIVSERGYAALYYPWIKVAVETLDGTADQVGLEEKFVPPSGYVAGVFARCDTERGVHKSPANEIVRGALDVKVAITRRDADILDPKGINCIRAFPGGEIRVWGDRTTASDAPWRYVGVRRLFLFLEKSIDEGTRWAVFEPNDAPLWAKVRSSVSEFLARLWRDGALTGTTAEEAYFVRCDRTTMTQNDIDDGRLICVIGVAPVRPAEFVIFRIGQWTAGASQAAP